MKAKSIIWLLVLALLMGSFIANTAFAIVPEATASPSPTPEATGQPLEDTEPAATEVAEPTPEATASPSPTPEATEQPIKGAELNASGAGDEPIETLEAIPPEPMVSIAFSTNAIVFENVSPLEPYYEKASALSVAIVSNYGYSLYVEATDDFVSPSNERMPLEHLKIKNHTADNYHTMSKNLTIPIAENETSTEGKAFDIDFRLNSDWELPPGRYTAELMFTVSQIAEQ